MRRFRYYADQVLRFRTRLVAAPISRLLRKWLLSASFDGIKIVDLSLRRGVDQRFQSDTVAALSLIKSVDPRRFRRVQREIEFIVNVERLRFASYGRPLKECAIDYSRMEACEQSEWYRWWYATVLVHEATHGAIDSRHVAYTRSLRVRIERLCHTEAHRFARKVDREDRKWSDALVGEFDEKNWHRSWHATFSQRMSWKIARFREALQNRPK